MLMTTMSQRTLQHVTMDTAVDRSLEMAATMVGLPKSTVTKIVEAGLPLMANVADENPLVFAAMYAQSVKTLPEPMHLFYAKLAKSPIARQAMVDDFTTMFGDQTQAITRGASRQSRVTEAHASQVLAATMPAVVQALGMLNTSKNELGFGRQLRNVNA